MECSPGSAFIVKSEADSMGGFLDGRVEIGIKASPHRAAIEKAQSKLRQEFDVRDERRRELEFLEKGGDPLDFKLGQKTSVSVQSSSQKGQDIEQIVTSTAKGSSFTASPLGDFDESSGRPGGPNSFEPNSADNLLLFDVENELHEGGTNSTRPTRRNINAMSQKSSKRDSRPNGKGSEDSAIFRPYARRNRSRSNRDGPRSSSTDVTSSCGDHVSYLPTSYSFRDTRGSILETNSNLKDQNTFFISNTKSASTNGDPFAKGVVKHNPLDMELSGRQETSAIFNKGGVSEDALCVTVPKDTQDNELNCLLEVDAPPTVVDTSPNIRSIIVTLKEIVPAGCECSTTCVARTQNENENSFHHLSGCSSPNREKNSTQNEDQISCAAVSTNFFDIETTSNKTSLTLKKNNESDLCIITGDAGDTISPMDHMGVLERTGNLLGEVMVQGMSETRRANDGAISNDDHDCIPQNHKENDSIVRVEEDLHTIRPSLQIREINDYTVRENDRKPDSNSKPDREISSTTRTQCTIGSSICELTDATSSGREPSTALDLQNCSNHLEVANKEHEDSILDKARTIEAKRKRISALSVGSLVLENRGKSHWDFVLEEMAWLANDFAQEHLWKIVVASHISKLAVSTSQSRFEEHNFCRKKKKVALTLAKAVTSFWRSVEASVTSDNSSHTMKSCNFVQSAIDYGYEVDDGKFGDPNIVLERRKDLKVQHIKIAPVKEYAVRFLKNNRSIVSSIHVESCLYPERMSDLGIQETLLEDHFTEQSLFYKVPSGAVQTYRKSIESCLMQCEKTGSSMMQEEVDTTMYDAFEELSQMNKYDEEEAETSMYYYQGGFRGNKPSKLSQKKRNKMARAYNARSYEIGADFPYAQGNVGSHQSILLGKRSSNNLNVGSIPTKRMRTASRQRLQSLHSAGATGRIQALNTDASSGDTNSYADDQSTFYSGPQFQKSLEAESVVDFEKLLPFDSGEISTKPKKKKRAKHLNTTHEQRWQLDSVARNEQRDNSKKRLDSLHLESNGDSGLFGKHNAKRPKLTKHALDNTFHNVSPINGSVASQMSNMSNTTKFMKLIASRDQCRKTKMLMMSSGQPCSGNPWSLFEDQELVVLVHDLGPNWELVSDVINNTLQFKCIFRNPKECKERHKSLMDTTASDGADSAEDSGSSQPYRTTLTGIPRGSARQLFQRLQRPLEEGTLKSHFEKIITIGESLHGRNQVDNQDLKQVAPVHNSHIMALSLVCPNNLNGGFLSPLDLCDASPSSPDILSHGYQSHVSSDLSITNQGSSATNLSQQGSSSKVLSGIVSSSSGPINASVRDGRYVGPKASLPIDEHPQLQQYNPTISGRNVQQSSYPASGVLSGTERGTRTIPGGNGMGLLGGLNRSMPMSRPGFPVVSSSSMINSGSMIHSGMVGMPSPGTVHPGSSTGRGNPMLQPREAMHIMRPGQNPEHQMQMILPELQMQAKQGNSQGIVSFDGPSSNFSNQTASPTPTYPVHSPQHHHMPSQQSHVLQSSHIPHHQQATAARHPAYAQFKRQLHQQRMMQHQQHQFSASNALLQTNSQIQQTSQPLSVPSLDPSSPMTPVSLQIQQKPNLQPHGIGQTPKTGASGLNSQTGKPRQRQEQHQQSGRQHPQQQQQLQYQHQAKILKGIGRGNMLINQNLSVDPSRLNGISMATGSQVSEKGVKVMHMMQGQGLYSGPGLNSAQPTQPMATPQSSSQSHMQQNLFSVPTPPLSKQTQQMPSHSGSGSQSHGQSVLSGSEGLASSQVSLPSGMSPNHRHQQQSHIQTHQKHVNQIQLNVQRVNQNCPGNSDLPNNSGVDQPHPDQRPVNDSNSHIGSVKSMPQVSMGSTHVTPASSSSSAQWKASDPVYHPILPINQSIVQKQFSGSLPPQTHAAGKQWQQQPHIKEPMGIPPTHQQQEVQVEESQQEELRQL